MEDNELLGDVISNFFENGVGFRKDSDKVNELSKVFILLRYIQSPLLDGLDVYSIC